MKYTQLFILLTSLLTLKISCAFTPTFESFANGINQLENNKTIFLYNKFREHVDDKAMSLNSPDNYVNQENINRIDKHINDLEQKFKEDKKKTWIYSGLGLVALGSARALIKTPFFQDCCSSGTSAFCQTRLGGFISENITPVKYMGAGILSLWAVGAATFWFTCLWKDRERIKISTDIRKTLTTTPITKK